jgi:hypothetical protein
MSRLQDDLLKDFREQKGIINRQIELFDPLATSLRRPAAQRLMSKGFLVVVEVLMYLMFVAGVVFGVVMNLFYPFTALAGIHYINSVAEGLSYTDAEGFSIVVHVMAMVIGVLFLVIGRLVRRIRLKNDVLDLAGKNIKTLVGEHLKRKAMMEMMEQRHFLELPAMSGSPDVFNPNETEIPE